MRNHSVKKGLLRVVFCFAFIAAVFIVLSKVNVKKTASGEQGFTYVQDIHQDSGKCYVDRSRIQKPTVIKIPDSAKVQMLGEDTSKVCTIMGIAPEAFKDEKNLKEVTIPATVTEIGKDAFSGCDNLTKVIFLGTKEQWEKVDIAEGNKSLTAINAECQ